MLPRTPKRAACEFLIVARVMYSHEIREEPALIDAGPLRHAKVMAVKASTLPMP